MKPLSHSPSPYPIKQAHLQEILTLSHQEFISRVYELALGRSPDEGGEKHYLARLLAGVPKIQIATELLNSAEAIRHQSLSSTHSIDTLSSPNAFFDIENLLALTYSQLISLNGSEFVLATYLNLLGRIPDVRGLDTYLSRINGGEPKISILIAVSKSAEFGQRQEYLRTLHTTLTNRKHFTTNYCSDGSSRKSRRFEMFTDPPVPIREVLEFSEQALQQYLVLMFAGSISANATDRPFDLDSAGVDRRTDITLTVRQSEDVRRRTSLNRRIDFEKAKFLAVNMRAVGWPLRFVFRTESTCLTSTRLRCIEQQLANPRIDGAYIRSLAAGSVRLPEQFTIFLKYQTVDLNAGASLTHGPTNDTLEASISKLLTLPKPANWTPKRPKNV